MSGPRIPDTDKDRLTAISGLTSVLLNNSDNPRVWAVAMAIKQIAMGTTSVDRARAELED